MSENNENELPKVIEQPKDVSNESPEANNDVSSKEKDIEKINEETVIHLKTNQVVSIFLYLIGAIFMFIAFKFLFSDLKTYGGDQYQFSEQAYVGGDAYNFIISAARSAAVMVKSLVYTVIGCTSLLAGLINWKR
jgi:hypothetical protein